MKKVLNILSIFILSFSLVACGEEKVNKTPEVQKPSIEEAAKPKKPSKADFSFENKNLASSKEGFNKIFYSYYTSDSYLNAVCGNSSIKEFLDLCKIAYEEVSDIKEETFRDNVENNLFIFVKDGSFSMLEKSECKDDKEVNYVDSVAYSIDKLKEKFKDYTLIKVDNSELKKGPFVKPLELVNKNLSPNFNNQEMHFIDQIYYSYFNDEVKSKVLNEEDYEKLKTSNLVSLRYYLDVLDIPYTISEDISEKHLLESLENNLCILHMEDTANLYGRDRVYDRHDVIIESVKNNEDSTKYLYKVEKISIYPDNTLDYLELSYDELIDLIKSDLFKLDLILIDNSVLKDSPKYTISEVKLPGFVKSEWEVENTLYENYHKWDMSLPLRMEDPNFDSMPCTKLAAWYVYNYINPNNQLDYEEEVLKNDWLNDSVSYYDFVNAGYFGVGSTNIGITNVWDFKEAIDNGELVNVAISMSGMLNYTRSSSDFDEIGYKGDRYDWIKASQDEMHQVICYGYMYDDNYDLMFKFYDPTEVEFILPSKAFYDGTIEYYDLFTWKVKAGEAEIIYNPTI